jgi:hypothetical protein
MRCAATVRPGKKISTFFGAKVLGFLKAAAPESADATDLAAYFVRRGFDLLRPGGDLAVITTNSIAEGDTRAAGLQPVTAWGGDSVDAVTNVKWEGATKVSVSVVHVHPGVWTGVKTLNRAPVPTITPMLTADAHDAQPPQTLQKNTRRAFVGSFVRGSGFVLDPEEAQRLLARSADAAQVVKPYWSAEDITRLAPPRAARFVIDFQD